MKRNIFIPLLLLHLTCGQPSTLTFIDFIYYDQQMNWKDAQAFCREKHVDLVTIRSEEENQVLSSQGSWIGLYREENKGPWKWSRGDERATFFNWEGNEPQDNEFCARKLYNSDYSKKWKSAPCVVKHPFICYNDTLVLVKENKTWEEALEHCRSMQELDSENPATKFWKHSYDLATLMTEDDHNTARQRAQEATTDEVWTGLRYLGDEWFWMGGGQVQYQDIPSCPAARCGVLENNIEKSFGIRACSQRRNFLCYKRLKDF